MAVDGLVDLFREQSRACRTLGSPFYAVLLDRIADDVRDGGPAAAVLVGREQDTTASLLPLRVAGEVHRLVLAGRVPDLEARFPSTGGDGDAERAWPAVREALAGFADEVRQGLALPPQTNEVGRAAPLFGGLLHVARRHGLPVRLFEIGASAGLNLRADRFRYVGADGGSWGPPSPVVLDPAWGHVPAGLPESVEIVERVGGDLSPVDPTTEDGALRLASFVWPDQVERLARLRGAIEVAREVPVRLEPVDVLGLLDQIELVEGTLTVVWHSVMWQYVPLQEKLRATVRLDELGLGATPTKPLAHIAFEPRKEPAEHSLRFLVTARVWPGGSETVLGHAPPHGVPVSWGAPLPGDPVAGDPEDPAAPGPTD